MTLTSALQQQIALKLVELYGPQAGTATAHRIFDLISTTNLPSRSNALSERDVILIAYGDHIQEVGESPLNGLRRFLARHLHELISTVHILPFYPYSSDDGFSVVDYRAVNPALGTWQDIQRLKTQFKLMFDLVLNHVSSQSAWFQAFLRNEAPYRDYFISVDPRTDLSLVTRPRTLPVLTPFQTSTGTRHVWTTFSEDQVDLNFANPDVLLEIIQVLLFYVQQGAGFIRLDAIAYLWKLPGTTCIHLPQTHRVVRLLRDVLDAIAPWVKLITETNVPHEENLSYFGDGTHEAQLVYNFALPPLLLEAVYTGDSRTLSHWASTLKSPSTQTTLFNFTASHDGIGVRPVTDLLSTSRIESMLRTIQERGGVISFKANPDGTQSAYEMNSTYFDALAVPGDPLVRNVERFIGTQAVMLALAGVPGIYLNSLFGAGNWHEGAIQTGKPRTLNRQKFDLATLESDFVNPASRAAQVFTRYARLLHIRRNNPAFHPASAQRILDLHPAVFAVERIPDHLHSPVLVLQNFSNRLVSVHLPASYEQDLYTGGKVKREMDLAPYGTVWLSPG